MAEIDIYSLGEFVDAYIECMMWSSTDNSDETGGNPLDDNYCVADITQESLQRIIRDCNDFQQLNAELLQQAIDSDIGYSLEKAGHDFWLTRNGHGAGFWDRGLGEIGEALTTAAKIYGSIDPIVANGQIHVE